MWIDMDFFWHIHAYLYTFISPDIFISQHYWYSDENFET